MWRPKLVIRRGKRGRVSSPTTTTGYVLFAGFGGLLSVAALLAALSGTPQLLLGLLLTPFFLRDAWAWFAASTEERDAFRKDVIALGGGPDRFPVRVRWRGWHLLGLALAAALGLAVLPITASLFPAVMVILAVLLVAALDLVREAWRARRRPQGTGSPRLRPAEELKGTTRGAVSNGAGRAPSGHPLPGGGYVEYRFDKPDPTGPEDGVEVRRGERDPGPDPDVYAPVVISVFQVR